MRGEIGRKAKDSRDKREVCNSSLNRNWNAGGSAWDSTLSRTDGLPLSQINLSKAYDPTFRTSRIGFRNRFGPRSMLVCGMRDVASVRNAGRCIRELLAALRQDPQQLSRGLHPALGSGVYGLRGEAVRPGVSVPRCRRFSRSLGPRRRPGGDRRAWGDQSGSLSPWQDPPFRTPTTSASWTPPPGSSSALSRPAAIPTPWRSFRSRSEPALCAGTASEFNLLERPPPFPGKVIQVRKQRSYFPVGEAWLRRRIVATPTRKQAGERRRRRGPRGDWPSDNDCGFSLVLRVCQGYL